MSASRSPRAIRWITLSLAAGSVLAGLPPLLDSGTRTFLLATGGLLALVALLPGPVNQRLLLLLSAALASLLLAEGLLRLSVGRQFTSIYEIDERYLHKLAPDSTKLYRRLPVNGGELIEVRVNGQGYRGDDLPARREGPWVVVYGDSFVAAEFSRRDRTFTGQLKMELHARMGAAPTVINAGVMAYGPDQVSLRLEDELPFLRPDLVVVAIYAGNDFGELLRNKIYRLDVDGRLRRHAFRIHPRLRAKFDGARRGLVLTKVLEKAFYHLAAGEYLTGDVLDDANQASLGAERKPTGTLPRYRRVESWLHQRRLEYERYVLEGNDEVTNILGDTYDADVSCEPKSPSARYKIRLMDQLISRLARTCIQHGAPLMLLIIPSPIDVSEHYTYAQVDNVRHPHYRRSANTDVLEQIAWRHGIPHVNLFDTFRGREISELYFRGGNDHWNDEGQRLAAKIVADFVITKELIPAPEG